jgi:hypothetical protein
LRKRRVSSPERMISGAILSAMMLATLPFEDAIGFDRGEIIGYTTMVLSFLLIFFGARSYRDNVAGGRVSFGRALAVSALIGVVSSLCYVATWELIYFKLSPDFVTKYQAHMMPRRGPVVRVRRRSTRRSLRRGSTEPCSRTP